MNFRYTEMSLPRKTIFLLGCVGTSLFFLGDVAMTSTTGYLPADPVTTTESNNNNNERKEKKQQLTEEELAAENRVKGLERQLKDAENRLRIIKREERVKARQQSGIPREQRLKFPVRNQSCYTTPEEQAFAIARRSSPGMHVWQEWAQWYCRAVPLDAPKDKKNMTHELFLQLKCLQQGFDALQMPVYWSGGTMIGFLTVRGMNIYEVDNDGVVPSWFDVEELQDYFTDLPEGDMCRDMIIFEPDEGVYRSCFGITDKQNHCERKDDNCSQIFRPYSDVYKANQFMEELWMFDAENASVLEHHSDRVAFLSDKWAWSKKGGRKTNKSQPLVEDYKSLFLTGDNPIPFVNETQLQEMVRQKRKQGKRKWNRQLAFEQHMFEHFLAKERFVMSDGSSVTVMREDMSKFLCDYKYGQKKWWHYPMRKRPGFYRRILDNCNSVYFDDFNHHENDSRIRKDMGLDLLM